MTRRPASGIAGSPWWRAAVCVAAAGVTVSGVIAADMIGSRSWLLSVAIMSASAMVFEVAALWVVGAFNLALRAARRRRGSRGSVVESTVLRAAIVSTVAALTTAGAATICSAAAADGEISLDDVRLFAVAVVLTAVTNGVAVAWMAGALGDAWAALRQWLKRR